MLDFRYYSGCSVTIDASQGMISSPAYGISDYPTNQECSYLIKRPGGGPLSLKVSAPKDVGQEGFQEKLAT